MQYTPPGALGVRTEEASVALERAMEAARWNLGPLRIEPWVTVKDVTYVDNTIPGGTRALDPDGQEPTDQEADVSDLTASAGAGIRAYWPIRDRLTLAAHLLPEYVWWRDQSERRQLNGRYGVGMFGFFARSSFELTATRNETQRLVTQEVETLISTRRDNVGVAIEVPLGGRLGLIGSGYVSEFEHLEGEPDDSLLRRLDRFDRDEQVARAGLQYRTEQGWSVSLGVEDSEVEFAPGAIEQSNSGTSPFVVFDYQSELFLFHAEVVDRDLEPDGLSSFAPFDEPTGELRLHYFTGNRLRAGLYSTVQLGYSLSTEYTYFESNRTGARISTDLGWRSQASVFVETGSNDYTGVNETIAARKDDVTALGGQFSIQLSDRLVLSVGATLTDYDSNLGAFDRDLALVRAGLSFGGGSGPWW